VDRLRCAHCQDVIGVYEPVAAILRDGTRVEGSWLTLGCDLQAAGKQSALHARCYEEVERGALSPRSR
jgi:hypothetical protein